MASLSELMVLQCIILSKEEKKMRKFVQIMLLACLVIFSTQVAFANADKATVQEGADLTDVHRLAIASPLYMPRKDAPSKDELLAIMSKASSFARCYVLSYDMVAEEIQKDNGVDIRALDRRQASKVYKEGVAKTADAYVVLTVANNGRTNFFFDVYKSGTNDLLYTYQIVANKSEPDNEVTFNLLCEQFFKNFERSVGEQAKGKK